MQAIASVISAQLLLGPRWWIGWRIPKQQCLLTRSWAERDQTRYSRGMVSTQLIQLMLSLDFLNQRSLFVEVAAAPQMAYVLTSNSPGKAAQLTCQLAASTDSPAVNPALVIKGWDESDVTVKVNGKAASLGKDVRVGYNHSLEGTDLVVWLKTTAEEPVTIGLSPVGG